MSGIVHCIEKALRGMTWRPYGLRSSETYPWRPVVLLNTACSVSNAEPADPPRERCARTPSFRVECGVREKRGLRESVRNDGAVASFRPG